MIPMPMNTQQTPPMNPEIMTLLQLLMQAMKQGGIGEPQMMGGMEEGMEMGQDSPIIGSERPGPATTQTGQPNLNTGGQPDQTPAQFTLSKMIRGTGQATTPETGGMKNTIGSMRRGPDLGANPPSGNTYQYPDMTPYNISDNVQKKSTLGNMMRKR